MDFGSFNSAEKTLPSPSLSPALDISSPFEIHLHLQHHFPEILFCRNMRISRDSFHDLLMFRERTHAGSHSLRVAVPSPVFPGGEGMATRRLGKSYSHVRFVSICCKI